MTTPWRRDAAPGRLCGCGHLDAFHNIETKSQPCGSCTCTAFTPGALVWHEHRTVTEEVKP